MNWPKKGASFIDIGEQVKAIAKERDDALATAKANLDLYNLAVKDGLKHQKEKARLREALYEVREGLMASDAVELMDIIDDALKEGGE